MTELVTVFGGSGFVGKYVVRALCKAGIRVRVAMRRPHLGNDLRVMGVVGQVQLIQANIRNPESIARAIDGADAVINLVGIITERGKQTFDSTIHHGSRLIAEATKAAGIKQLVQISAIGANKDSKSDYFVAKAMAEDAVLKNVPTATILRPSVIFGTEDKFYNKFAAISRLTSVMPLIGGGQTMYQPVYVGDVAEAVLKSLDNDAAQGKVFELGGPETYSFEQVIKYIQETIVRPRSYVKVPYGLMKLFGGIIHTATRFIPFLETPFTSDQIEMMKTDNVVSENALGFKDLGIARTTAVEAIAPSFLYRFRPRGQFEPKVIG